LLFVDIFVKGKLMKALLVTICAAAVMLAACGVSDAVQDPSMRISAMDFVVVDLELPFGWNTLQPDSALPMKMGPSPGFLAPSAETGVAPFDWRSSELSIQLSGLISESNEPSGYTSGSYEPVGVEVTGSIFTWQ
jgi:hypothetical protein